MSHHIDGTHRHPNMAAHLLLLGLAVTVAAIGVTVWPAARTFAWTAVAAAVVGHVGAVIAVFAGISLARRRRRHEEGVPLRWARFYDVLVPVITLGRERALRGRMLDLARVADGDRVLDVGCGTGTLAIGAKRRAGSRGMVRGVDASPQMIARASAKARKAGLDVAFEVASAEALPFGDASFDVVLCTLVLHHLPSGGPPRAIAEMRRVLRPGGRLLVVELTRPGGLLAAINPIALIHGHQQTSILHEAEDHMRDAGFAKVELGSIGVRSLGFVKGEKP